MVLRAVELGGKDAGAGAGTENAQIEHEQKLVNNGHAAHGDGSHLTNHNIVQKGHEIGDAVLDDDGQSYGNNPPVKGFVAYIFFDHKKPR